MHSVPELAAARCKSGWISAVPTRRCSQKMASVLSHSSSIGRASAFHNGCEDGKWLNSLHQRKAPITVLRRYIVQRRRQRCPFCWEKPPMRILSHEDRGTTHIIFPDCVEYGMTKCTRYKPYNRSPSRISHELRSIEYLGRHFDGSPNLPISRHRFQLDSSGV